MRLIDSRISERSHEALLNLSNSQFVRVEREATRVLGAMLERRINEDQLVSTQLGVAAQLDPDTSVFQAALVEELVAAYLRATLVPDPAATAIARDAAAQAVPRVAQTYVEDAVIVASGATVDEVTAEALSQLAPAGARVPLGPLVAMVLLGVGASVACGLFSAPRPARRRRQ